MIRIAVAGAGRMGQAIARRIESRDDLQLAGTWRRGEALEVLLRDADVVIDFNLPAGTLQVLEAVQASNTPLVCGVSGLDEQHLARLDEVAASIPVVYDRNMSLGIAVLDRAVRDAAASLGKEFGVAISEVHHVHKLDAPSGTALKLGETIAAARGEEGMDAIRFASERRGEVPGDHEVVMSSATERLTFAHSVTTRDVFADGAVRAAAWVIGQPPGRYRMSDVLFGARSSA